MAKRDKHNKSSRGIVLSFTLLATLLIAVLSFYLPYVLNEAFPVLDASVGEMLLDQGKRHEAAGSIDYAIAAYEKALNARFEGPQNRKETEQRLETLRNTTMSPNTSLLYRSGNSRTER